MTTRLKIDYNSEGYAKYPPEADVRQAKDILKPAGILSNSFNKQGLKKVEREFVPAKNNQQTNSSEMMRQTDYRRPDEEGDSKYFHIQTQRGTQRIFDRVNSVTEGYNQKLHRDDREHAKLHGLFTHEEECRRSVPATSNSIYGHPYRYKLEKNTKEHGHREQCKEEFNSRNGINFSS